jgi:uncharacterized protein (TIGR02466 family)
MIEDIFPTRISRWDLSDHPQLTLARQIAENIAKEPHGLIDGARSSYATGLTASFLRKPLIQSLTQEIHRCINLHAEQVGLPTINIGHSWVNIMGQGQRVERHRHELSVLSGAFYLSAPPGSCGLKFHSPTAGLRMLELVNNAGPETTTNFHFTECREGELIIFPSWLEHSTDLNQADGRIVVSFNTQYKDYTFTATS